MNDMTPLEHYASALCIIGAIVAAVALALLAGSGCVYAPRAVCLVNVPVSRSYTATNIVINQDIKPELNPSINPSANLIGK